MLNAARSDVYESIPRMLRLLRDMDSRDGARGDLPIATATRRTLAQDISTPSRRSTTSGIHRSTPGVPSFRIVDGVVARKTSGRGEYISRTRPDAIDRTEHRRQFESRASPHSSWDIHGSNRSIPHHPAHPPAEEVGRGEGQHRRRGDDDWSRGQRHRSPQITTERCTASGTLRRRRGSALAGGLEARRGETRHSRSCLRCGR